MKNQDLIISEINKIINAEIKYLNSCYDYDLKKFFCPELFYCYAFLAFFNLEEINDFRLGESYYINNYLDDKENTAFFNTYKVINLIAGIELFAIGLKIHASQEKILRKISDQTEDSEKNIEKNYTIELLFGDIFYSRAISYLIKFDDFVIFDNILKSILAVHHSRIIIHQKIKDIFNDNKNIYWFFNRGFSEVKMLNSLLKEMFYTGIGISSFDVSGEKTKDFFVIIDEMVLLKTYNDLADYIRQSFPGVFTKDFYDPGKDFHKKADIIRRSLEKKLNRLEPEWIKRNLMGLFLKME